MNARRYLKSKFFLIAVALTLFGASAQAAVVYLKDGSRLQGTVVNATARDIKLLTTDGTLNINTDRILRVEYQSSESQTPPPAPQTEPLPAQIENPPPAEYPRRRSRRVEYPVETSDFSDMRQMFSFDLGFAVPMSRVDFSPVGGTGDNGNTGVLIGTQYIYFLNPRLGTGLDLEYFSRSQSSSGSLLPTADTNVSGDTLLLLGVLRYSLTTRGYARPYVLAGIGTNRTSTVIDATPNLGFAWSDTNTDETRRLVDDSHWGFASTARVGIDFHFMDPALFSFEIGWTGISNDRYQATSQGQDLGLNSVSGVINALNIAGRWGWRF